jgi:poly-beta-1,6-N-acetyl-D-glucosamine synthase
MRHLVIVPARNEARFIGDMLMSLLRQTEPPDRIVIVDDGSSDGTSRIVAALIGEHRSLELLRHETRTGDVMGPAVARAFALAYRRHRAEGYSYTSKFDADLVFPEHYCATVLRHLEAHPDIGVAGGVLVDEARGAPARLRVAPNHVVGALKTFRHPALAAIGGLEEVPGWDIIDQVKLRILGWQSAALESLPVLHRRAHGSREGRLSGRADWGAGAWAIGSHPLFVLGRGFYRMLEPPYLIGGLAFWGGYLLAALKKTPRLRDPVVIARLRQEQLSRLRLWNRRATTFANASASGRTPRSY